MYLVTELLQQIDLGLDLLNVRGGMLDKFCCHFYSIKATQPWSPLPNDSLAPDYVHRGL